MEYVKKLLVKEFRALYNYTKPDKEHSDNSRAIFVHKTESIKKIKGIIMVCRLIMSMQEIELLLMPYRDFCVLEQDLKHLSKNYGK